MQYTISTYDADTFELVHSLSVGRAVVDILTISTDWRQSDTIRLSDSQISLAKAVYGITIPQGTKDVDHFLERSREVSVNVHSEADASDGALV